MMRAQVRTCFAIGGAMSVAGALVFVSVSCSPFEPGSTPPVEDGSAPSAEASGPAQDGGVDAAAKPLTFCTTHVPPTGYTVLYCDDFDDGGAAGDNVNNGTAKVDGGSITLDLARFTSPPGAAHATLTNPTAGATGATIDIPIPGSIARIVVTYDIWLNPTADLDPIMGGINTGGPCDYLIYSGQLTGGAKMRARERLNGNFSQDVAQRESMLRGEWHHVVWDFALASGEVVLKIDADPSNGVGVMTEVCRSQVASLVRVGLPFGADKTLDAWIDNVVVEAK